jgi:hypothetical protein
VTDTMGAFMQRALRGDGHEVRRVGRVRRGVSLSPHKFVGGPGTPGILLMNKALYRLAGAPPSTCGGGTVAYVNGFSEAVSHSSLFPVPGARRA